MRWQWRTRRDLAEQIERALPALMLFAVAGLTWGIWFLLRMLGIAPFLLGWSRVVAFVLAVATLVAAFVFVRWLTMRRGIEWSARLRGGLCLYCGYNLRGTVGKCPECGKPIDEAIYRATGFDRSKFREPPA